MSEKKKSRKSLSAFTILLLIIIVLAAVTWFVPDVESATFSTIVMAPYNGFVDAMDVCAFVMVLGGFLGIVGKTGCLEVGIKALVKKLNGKEIVLIPILMCIFALGGTTYGMCEETVAFYALLSSTMLAAGFDTLVASATIMLGAGIGCLGSTVNTFATGIASSTLRDAGIECSQTVVIGLGLVLLVVNLAIAIYFVMKYAKHVKAGKGSFLSAEELAAAQEVYGEEDKEEIVFDTKKKVALIVFAFTFVVMIIAVLPWFSFDITMPAWTGVVTGQVLGDWWFGELAMWFFLSALVIGAICGLSEKEMVDSFIAGVADIISVVLVIAVARGASVLMKQTGLDMYLLNAAANALNGLPAFVFAPMSYLVYIGLSFLIPSTSGCASATMGIMGGLTARLGYNPAVMVLVFSAASGLVNLFTPTSGVVMGGLSLARVNYSTWLKWVSKVVICCAIASAIILTVAMVIL